MWPISQSLESTHSGQVEITWINGRKVLDTQHANYSFGSLERVLDFGFDLLDFSQINSVLILGLGGGSAIHSLRSKYGFSGTIQAVEWDEVILSIAEKEFGIFPNEETQIIHEDALLFIQHCSHSFDLILVDLFIDDKIPSCFLQKSFNKLVIKRMQPQGKLIFNLGMWQNAEVQSLIDFYSDHFACQVYHGVEELNTLLLVENN